MLIKKQWKMFALGLAALFIAQANAEPKTIELDGPSEAPAALFVQELLEEAYSNIGIKVTYRQIPLARSFVEANKGELDGLRARTVGVAKAFNNLVQVPYELFDFSVVLIGDRRICGACELSQLDTVVVPRGFQAFEELFSQARKKLSITEVTSGQQSLDMLLAGKVQGAIISDVQVPEEYFELNHHWVKNTLAVFPDFHYLHKKHRHLIPQLTAELRRLESVGFVSKLRTKHGIKVTGEIDNKADIGRVSAVSAAWNGYTDSKDGTYWRALRSVFDHGHQSLDFYTFPWATAKQKFIEGEVDMLVGAFDVELEEGMIRSNLHLDYDEPVTAFGNNIDTLKAQVEGNLPSTACYVRGFGFDAFLPESVNIIETIDIQNCIELLEQKKVDLALHYSLFVGEEVRSSFAQVEVVEARPLFVFFKDSSRGLRLKDMFEKGYRALINIGDIEDYFPNKAKFNKANLIKRQNLEVSSD